MSFRRPRLFHCWLPLHCRLLHCRLLLALALAATIASCSKSDDPAKQQGAASGAGTSVTATSGGVSSTVVPQPTGGANGSAKPSVDELPAHATIGGRQFRITRGVAPGRIDDEACAVCHATIAESYRQVDKAHSFELLDDPGREDLAGAQFVHEATGDRFETITRDGGLYQRRFRIDEKGNRLAELEVHIDAALGSGARSRLYLHRSESGEVQILPAARYADAPGWRMAPGYDRADPPGFERPIDRSCIVCHADLPEASAESDAPDAPSRFSTGLPGPIGCQRCHGPGARHALLAADPSSSAEAIAAAIVDPAKLSPARRDDVCLQCHLQPSKLAPSVVTAFGRGAYSFQPGAALEEHRAYFDFQGATAGTDRTERFERNHHAYTLRKSRCYEASASTDSGALACVTCHDPHARVPEERRIAHYRERCVGCHDTEKGCTRAPKSAADGDDCVGCHMARRRPVDAAHITMTDHTIRRTVPPPETVPPPGRDAPPLLGEPRSYWSRPPPAGHAPDIYLHYAGAEAGSSKSLQALFDHCRTTPTAPVEVQMLVSSALLAGGAAGDAELFARGMVERGAAPVFAAAHHGLALARLGRDDEARAVLERVRGLDPLDPAIPFALAGLAMRRGEREAALELTEESLELRPLSVAAQLQLARLRAELGRAAPAAEAFARAIGLDPRRPAAYLGLARVRMQLGEWALALGALEQGLGVLPRDGALLGETASFLLAVPERGMQDHARALQYAERAVAAAEKDGGAATVRAVALLLQDGISQQAYDEAKRAESLFGDRATCLLVQAVALAQLGRMEQAARVHAEAVAVLPKSPGNLVRNHLERAAAVLFRRGAPADRGARE